MTTLPLLRTTSVNPLLDSLEDVMGFLNEIQLKYPEAISMASGRPDENYFDLEEFPAAFDRFVDWMSAETGQTRDRVLKLLGQYNRTKGIINGLLARYLQTDEGIGADPADIVVTVGTQEAMVLAVTTLCDRAKDVILIEDPAYVGITHYALISGYAVEPVPVNEEGICLDSLEEKIRQCQQRGQNVKLVYVIPDFQNPTGNSMPEANRLKLLELSERYDFLILEDNAYGEFAYGAGPSSPIKALDRGQRVVYMRSFSKTLYPSLRLAALVAGQEVEQGGKPVRLSDLLAKTKGYITVNTPSINQAVFGGILLQQDFSLRELNRAKVAAMKEKRDVLLEALEEHLGAQHAWARGISWNRPQGGFFLTITLPFSVHREEVIQCTEAHGVIFTPMSFFYLGSGGHRQLRLAFSNNTPDEIRTAVQRLAGYFKNQVKN